MPATVLVLVETINDYLPILEHQGFHLILAPTPAERAEAITRHSGQINAVLTRGPLGLYAEEIAALPNLKIICVIGAGYEHVDLQAAADRGITVTNGAGVNASSVADHAMALLLSLVRGIPRCDAAVRRGEWPKIMRPSLAGKRLGILGLGAVGMAIAKRAANGFDMSVSYHNRQHRSDVSYSFCSSPPNWPAPRTFDHGHPGRPDRHLINRRCSTPLVRTVRGQHCGQRGGHRRPDQRPGTTPHRRRRTGSSMPNPKYRMHSRR
jgi:lactate dehydrogenase-like 2-hydroxyacid dehydrogenase